MVEQSRPEWMAKNPYILNGPNNGGLSEMAERAFDEGCEDTARKLMDELEEIWETRCRGNRESFGSFVLSLMAQLHKEVENDG